MANRHGSFLAAAILLAASPALAQDVTVYGNADDYAAAVGADDFCLDFNGSPNTFVSGNSFGADVIFGSPEATDPTQVNWSSDAISDAGSTTSPNGVGPVDGTFTSGKAAFHFTFSSNGTPATVELYDEGAVLLGSFPAPNAPGFFGVVSSVPIKRFVLKPGDVNDGTGFLDRFFIDDFCVTAVIAAPPPPPAPDLSTQCHDLAAAVAAADRSAFRGRNRQHALANKLRVVCDRIDGGDAGSLCEALHKLENDILPKMDGERSPKDWVTDATVQQALEDQVNALITALENEIAALGGCPSDPSHDDGDDGDDGGAGVGGQGQGAAHGQGHGHGNGHGHGHNK